MDATTVGPGPDLEDRLRSLERYAAQMHAAGIVSVTDALTGPGELRMFDEAERRGLIQRDLQRIAPTARGFDFLSDLQALFLPD